MFRISVTKSKPLKLLAIVSTLKNFVLGTGGMFYDMPVSQACEQKEYFSNL